MIISASTYRAYFCCVLNRILISFCSHSDLDDVAGNCPVMQNVFLRWNKCWLDLQIIGYNMNDTLHNPQNYAPEINLKTIYKAKLELEWLELVA